MSFIKDLLWFINEVGELLPEGKGNYRNLVQRNKPTYYRSLRKLEEEGYIKKRSNIKSQTVYVITPAGKSIINKRLAPKPRKDGLATLITYDIPSDMNKQRTKFRRYLLRNGFTLIQKSLLISPNVFDDHLKEVMNELKISRYVKVVSGRFDYLKLND